MLALYALALFAGAYLLFLVEPMAAKMVLPLLGGAPAVWAACVVFFQAALLAGYAYAHWAPAQLGLRRHALVHLALLAVAASALPIGLRGRTPVPDEPPVAWLLTTLVVGVGAPFFALAATAPLVQSWFAATGHHRAADPYFLYVASNAGSLAALASYPAAVEPALRLSEQTRLWSWGYGLFVGLVAACAVALLRGKQRQDLVGPATPRNGAAVSRRQIFRWVALAFVPSSLMLGVTTYITTDVAPVPLLWILPLALYLLSCMLAFARPPAAVHAVMVFLLPVAIVLVILQGVFPYDPGLGPVIALHLAAFFVAAMVCHGELARDRPPAHELTAFYLWVAVGGVLGGAFNALLAPAVFNRIVEYPLVIVLVCFLRPRLPAIEAGLGGRPARRGFWREHLEDYRTLGWGLFGIFGGVLFYYMSYRGDWARVRLLERNFFGVVSVWPDRTLQYLTMRHGTTIHGMQSLEPGRRAEAVGYYGATAPIGQIFADRRRRATRPDIAVIGLGAGTLAAYAEHGQSLTFYEIDPAVVRIARDPEYFTYLADAEARGVRLRFVLGDGRLELARSPQRYGLLIADAFSSDAIPLHLLTREALHAYLDHLAEGGLLVFHLSSAYLRLAPVIADLALDAGLVCLYQDDLDVSRPDQFPSQWAVLARSAGDLGGLAGDPRWGRLSGRAGDNVWTDDYSNVLRVIHRRGGRVAR